jgi:hypothetical protein
MWGSPLLYERLTWPEVRRAASEERVCLIPVATLEDHGPHLPIDTDLRITAEVCRHPRCPIAIHECGLVDPELRVPAGAVAGHTAACIRA